MLKLTIRSILSNKVRFFMTTLVVTLGVTFVVASFALADSLRDTFGQLGVDISQGTDIQVRAVDEFGVGDDGNGLPVPEELLDTILAVDGVEAAAGGLFVFGTFPTDGQGESPTSQGPPSAASNWTEDEELSQLFLLDGRRPMGLGEFALGPKSLEDYDYQLGETYTIESQATGKYEMELVGVIQFGFPDDASLGSTQVVLDEDTAQLITGYDDSYQVIGARVAEGADPEKVLAAVEAALPDGYEALSQQETIDDFSEGFESFLGPFQTVLLVFAFIVLFVSTFIINNTFNIILSQRIKELGLLRAIGATGKQVRRSVIGESVIVGIVATILGLGLGILGAMGLRAVIESFVGDFAEGSIPLRLRTVIWAMGLGIGFTVAASLIPALKAARVPPIAALRDDITLSSRSNRGRTVFGTILAVLGVGATAFGLFGSLGTTGTLSLIGFGAAVVFVAVGVLGPLFAGKAASAIASPLPRILGTPGVLAKQNSARSPRRTAATAIALTIGLALVTTVSVVAASLQTSIENTLDATVAGDFVIYNDGGLGLPPTLAESLQGVDELDAVVRERPETVRLAGEITDLEGSTMDLVEKVVRLDVSEGSLSDGDPRSRIAISRDYATGNGVGIGDTLPIEFAEGGSTELSVVAIYDDDTWYGDYFVDIALLDELGFQAADGDLLLSLADGVETETARAAIEDAMGVSAVAKLQTRDEAIGSIKSQIDVVLIMATIFLALALVIALVGIVNTLTLSVFERTREIGLLRAVGMTRSQTRTMIRWEAIVVALFGALLGVVLGFIFGFAIVQAVPDDFIGTLVVPWLRIAIFLVVAVLFGLFAAVLPARRAARMNVLDAIAHA